MELRRKAAEEFDNSLPMKRELFNKLFDHLDAGLQNEACDHSLALTEQFLAAKEVDNVDEVIAWLGDWGGYCDCEILFNVEEKFEDDAIL